MSLEEAVKILKESNRMNWLLVDGTEETDFGIFLLREIKAIEVVLQAVEHGAADAFFHRSFNIFRVGGQDGRGIGFQRGGHVRQQPVLGGSGKLAQLQCRVTAGQGKLFDSAHGDDSVWMTRCV